MAAVRSALGRSRTGVSRTGLRLVLAACLLTAVCPWSANAVDQASLTAGRKKAQACAPCHGLNGISTNPDAPNLAGDNATYIIRQLKAFKSGTRESEQMTIMAQTLSEEDMAHLAAWYSNLIVTVQLPP